MGCVKTCPKCGKEYAVPPGYVWERDNFPICPHCGHHVSKEEFEEVT